MGIKINFFGVFNFIFVVIVFRVGVGEEGRDFRVWVSGREESREM